MVIYHYEIVKESSKVDTITMIKNYLFKIHV